MRKTMVGLIAALGLVLGTGGAAMAGEVNGNGDSIPGAHTANSICAFSGLDTQDISNGGTEDNPPGFDDDALAMRGNQKHGYHGVQNYGIFMKAGMRGMGIPNPGTACRGGSGE